jgi:hypothetical protein
MYSFSGMLKLSRTILIFLGLSAFDNFPVITTSEGVTTRFATELLFAILVAFFVGSTAFTVGAGLDLLFATTLVCNNPAAVLGLATGWALTVFFAFVVMARSKLNEIIKNSYMFRLALSC